MDSTLRILTCLLLLFHFPPAFTQAQTITRIGAIQGAGPAARPGAYTIEAVVTAVYPGLKPAGFYVQEVAPATDANPATSDALFVVQAAPTIAIGDNVRLSGTVLEASAAPSHDQAVLTEPTVQVLSRGNALPAFTALPAASLAPALLERYEGMRVESSVTLTVADVYSVTQRGELGLSLGGVAYQPTQFIDPNDAPATGTTSTGASNVPAVLAYQTANADRSIVLDDGLDARPQPVPYLHPTLGTIRVGSTIPRLRGILGYGYGKWRIQPLPGPADAPVFQVVRPSLPSFGRLDLKLVSFNVLNYFNGDGQGGGFPTARGAKTAADFARQRSKIIAALLQMNADLIGLTEIENDGTGPASALHDLVQGLNQATAPGTYAFINDGGADRQPHNSDVIRCALLYKPAAVRPLGPALVAAAPGVFERPPLAQLFITQRQARPDTLALIINHLKSKSGAATGPEADQNDGQGGSNNRRRLQARALADFIATRVRPAGSSRIISLGDYNANYEEDPIDILRASGLVVVTPPTSASYVFKGLTGSLDHCLVTPNLVGFIDVHKWNINSAEPLALQYDQAGAATDTRSPFRSSDHDPVMIGVNFAGLAPSNRAAARLFVYPNPAPGPQLYTLPAMPASAGPITLEISLPKGPPMLHLQGPAALVRTELNRYTAHLPPGLYLLHLQAKNLNQTRHIMKQ